MQNNKVYLGAAILLFLVAVASTQVAPGDEDERCTSQMQPYSPNLVMLMNSRHYTELLGDGGVWDQIDFDDNNPPSFNPTFFKHNAGGICRWSVMSCGYRLGWQDNWLFTQFISKTVPDNTNHTVRIIVDILYTLSSCRARFNCNADFRLYKFETDGPQPREVYTDVSNYELVRSKLGYSSLTQSLVESIEVPPNVGGLYLAVRDNRSCIQVAQMKVYHHQCARKQEGLVVFPDTAAPVDGDLTVTLPCMPNSFPVASVEVTCNANGHWNGSSRCRCDPGYYRVSGGEGDYCQSCPEGYYRSDTDRETECLPCPANTKEDMEAAPECQCLTGYFRNTEGLHHECPAFQNIEDVSFDCTDPPSAPLGLTQTESTDNSLSISWNRPVSDGGRSDLFYRVLYSDPDPDKVGVMIEANCTQSFNRCVTEHECTITDLQPATKYVVRVSAHNGVSDQNEGGALARLTQVTLETDIAPPSVVGQAEVFCDVVVWEAPAITNGEILHYELLFNYTNGTVLQFLVPGEKCFFVISPFYEPETSIKISAVNEAGAGPYISVDIPDCPWLGPVAPTGPTSERVPIPTTVFQTVTETATLTTTEVITTKIPIPSSIVVTVPTTVAITATVTDHITTTSTAVVTSTVVSTVVAPTPSPVVVQVPTTVTETITETSHSTSTKTETTTAIATTTVFAEPSPVLVPVPTTVVTTAIATEYITSTTTDTITATATTTVVTEPSPVLVPVPTTVTTTETKTDRITATTTAFVTTTAIHTPEPTQLPTCPEPTVAPPCPICDDSPPACPPCPTFTFFSSVSCARRGRRPGEVRNVQMLNCGMIVWDAPENADCCNDKLTYKVRFFNGTSFEATSKAHRKVMAVENSWIKFTAEDLPQGRPLKVMVKARKQDGVHSAKWVNAGPLAESYVVDCPSFN